MPRSKMLTIPNIITMVRVFLIPVVVFGLFSTLENGATSWLHLYSGLQPLPIGLTVT
ncbi:hypothetical protein C427_2567 [Paraglaciecola psychrophila 170]|uniref:CDP-diacylglycerol--glycerol-3-phosphate 3-phosphatidyltransferase n=1 Tax=Paraglaciecola psychrophila 170 TaxID=1129794 RepID=M4RM89_9ALTE|nr:hypothetical protein [Paraglaciecola psychrophila]AGH44676.1 hypothetical protein C427_2567 [Paraglaciecola psychrophila 170]